jgi:hypothetical protein
VCEQEISWYEEAIARAGLQSQGKEKKVDMTLMSDLGFEVNFIIVSLRVCMELHLIHFSSNLDNIWYQKSPGHAVAQWLRQ